MANNYYKAKTWNALCDSCGFKFKSDQLRKRWDGLMVDDACWEPRQPQDFLRAVQEYSNHLPWTRPDTEAITAVPVASFTATPTMGVVPVDVQFTDTSTFTPTSWAWTFGDGQTSTSQNPLITYSTAGIYNVTLTATNSAGSGSATQYMFVVAQPTPPPPPVGTSDTWDPARVASPGVLSFGNRTFASGSSFQRATCGLARKSTTNLKAYAEFLVGTLELNDKLGSVCFNPGTQTGGATVVSPFVGMRMEGSLICSFGSPTPPLGGSQTYSTGDVVGVTIDLTDKANHSYIAYYKNGTPNGTVDMQDRWSAVTTINIMSFNNLPYNHEWTMRTITSEFSYTPPTGFTAWGEWP